MGKGYAEGSAVEERLAALERGDLREERRARFTAVLGSGSHVRAGTKLRLAVHPSRFRYFDPKTGEAVTQEVVSAA